MQAAHYLAYPPHNHFKPHYVLAGGKVKKVWLVFLPEKQQVPVLGVGKIYALSLGKGQISPSSVSLLDEAKPFIVSWR